MRRRYDQLDSLRGLAAISVFLGHISIVTATPFISFTVSSIVFLPLKVFIGKSSYSFVNFFFVLSGFVLFLLFTKGKTKNYGGFIISRFFRIYIPYIVAVTVSIITYLSFSKGGIKELSGWFNLSWTVPLTLKDMLDHIMMIGNFNTNLYNNVLWSLVQEMRVSLIFPIIAVIIIRVKWHVSLLMCFCLSFISGLNNIFNWENSLGYHTSFFASLQIISMFILGSLLAKHLYQLIEIYVILTKNNKIVLLIFTVSCFIYNEALTVVANHLGIYQYGEIMSDYSIGVGSVLVILISLASIRVQSVLLIKPLLFLGRISYSLYLYHLPILFSLIYVFYKILPLWSILIISIPLAIITAHISWLIIERPASRYGKILASKVETFLKKRLVINGKYKVDKTA
ncbi:acyltransferase family protein [Neobacillus vireti]|uniref:Acyltransferase n=1 Tax=Neobacillus vireti LMG 21834 TaxID=1131730 RepID=A0AB94IKK9_9BACI|nr:acyltransferase [Neobacillus vireti]ETI67537.1 acyltransferase [Neobacillus vireti LMG 21834]